MTTMPNTPTMKNGGRGKNTHKLRMNTPSGKKTWAEVVKSGGINIQIVLGNSNLGLTTPLMKKRAVLYPTFKTHLKNGDSYPVMTQAQRQEPLLTTLHPLPAGSRIMGGQEKG
jgi:hypothetical protein